ncbi:MAG: hypothetical protein WAN35_18515 [Terracidiphilus sp.]
MKSWSIVIAKLGRLLGMCLASLCALICTSTLLAQDAPAYQPLRSEIKHFGSAEARSITKDSGFFPGRQPVVYWHDEDWTIDLLPLLSPNAAFTLKITSGDKREKIVTLPDRLAQIDSISRTPNEKAIITAELGGMTQAICIIDLREGKVIDQIGLYSPIISPDHRFIVYNNWYPPHLGGENMYRLYDVLKTPRENTCGYDDNDPKHLRILDAFRGFQVYPQKPNQTDCTDVDNDDDNVDASEFLWTADSSKLIFADAKSGVLSLVLVKMHRDKCDKDHDRGYDKNCDKDRNLDKDHDKDNDRPQTFIYPFIGAENVCGAIGPHGPTGCDYNKVKSIAWNGDAVNVVLVQANPTGPAILKNLTIPISKFVPLSK